MTRKLAAGLTCLVLLAALSVVSVILQQSRDDGRAVRKPNGHIVVSARIDGGWREIGRLPYRHQFCAKSLDLPEALGSQVVVKLERAGGGAAHVDAVTLDGMAPESASRQLKEASVRDWDVLDVSEEPLEATFAAGRRLEVAARVEPLEIAKEPFKFPRANLFREVTERSSFFKYTPGATAGNLSIDGEIADEELGAPLFAEYGSCVSGHPSGVTYGWVMDDGETLYAAIDFTQDNTLDGDADWAKVYVRTTDGIRTFKVSVNDTKWGRPGFTYTDKVGYRHKVYEFAIPMKEIARRKPSSNLALAFATYGTAAPGVTDRMMAFDPVNETYMFTFCEYVGGPNENDVFAEVYDSAGATTKSLFGIRETTADEYTPGIAANTEAGGFLALWFLGTSDPVSVIGERYTGAGAVTGSPITVSPAPAGYRRYISGAYEESTDRYFIAWMDQRTGLEAVWGQAVAADGSVVGSNVDVFGEEWSVTWQEPVVVAANPGDGFLVLMPAGNRVRRVSATGTPFGTTGTFTLSGSGVISAAFDPVNDRYLVVRGNSTTIYGTILDSNGSDVTTDIVIAPLAAATTKNNPSVACDHVTNRFLVSWDESDGSGDYIRGQILDLDGTLVGSVIDIETGTASEEFPTTCENVADSNFGVGFLADGSPTIRIVAQATAPDLSILGNSKLIHDGDSTPRTADLTDFGDVGVSAPAKQHTFSIVNNGTVTRTLVATPVVVTGTGFSAFSQPGDLVLSAGESTSFIVEFDPSGAGAVTGTVTVTSNDPVVPTYTFDIAANAIIGADIAVVGKSIDITNGDTSPSTTDDTDFGQIPVNFGEAKTFTITNEGDSDLTLTNYPRVTVTGTDVLLSRDAKSPVAPGASTDFQILILPTSIGQKTGSVSIASNDGNENPFTFDVQGWGVTYTAPTFGDAGDDCGANTASPDGRFAFAAVALGAMLALARRRRAMPE